MARATAKAATKTAPVKRTAPEMIGDAVGGGDIAEIATVTEDEAAEPHVKMVFPKEVRLTRDDHTIVHFKAGIQKVPESLSDHWWLKANGVVADED